MGERWRVAIQWEKNNGSGEETVELALRLVGTTFSGPDSASSFQPSSGVYLYVPGQ